MIRIGNVKVFNFDGAIRGMRNPLESWNKIDSHFNPDGSAVLGNNDLGLMKRLFKAGTDHRKFTRQILVSMDITAPLYWWKEFDTYKVGTVANSESSMHRVMSKEFTSDMFSWDNFIYNDDVISSSVNTYRLSTIDFLNYLRDEYLETKDKAVWKTLIQSLPDSWNQTRTITLNYEVLYNMYHSRKAHKLSEWREFLQIICEQCPYFVEIGELNPDEINLSL